MRVSGISVEVNVSPNLVIKQLCENFGRCEYALHTKLKAEEVKWLKMIFSIDAQIAMEGRTQSFIVDDRDNSEQDLQDIDEAEEVLDWFENYQENINDSIAEIDKLCGTNRKPKKLVYRPPTYTFDEQTVMRAIREGVGDLLGY